MSYDEQPRGRNGTGKRSDEKNPMFKVGDDAMVEISDGDNGSDVTWRTTSLANIETTLILPNNYSSSGALTNHSVMRVEESCFFLVSSKMAKTYCEDSGKGESMKADRIAIGISLATRV